MKIKSSHYVFPALVGFFILTIISCTSYILFVFNARASTPADLRNTYIQASTASSTRKIKILIVPGHDNQYWGTEFRNVKEADMTLRLGLDLYSLLKQDPHFDVTISRTGVSPDDIGYTEQFTDYFNQNQQAISDFITTARTSMKTNLANGSIQKVDGVPHNTANPIVTMRLFGIDKWVNDNNVDLVFHIHFNDNPERSKNNPGPYRGFTVYVPEHQYNNASTSLAFGQALYDKLHAYYAQSNLPQESAGLVEDQDLIAIGPGNSVNAAVALVEFGYIYEPQFLDANIRSQVIDDLAFQTFLGFHEFFGDDAQYKGVYGTPLLPYTWTSGVKFGTLHNSDILALQAALRSLNLLPDKNMTNYDCRMTGNFDPCTKKALTEFQQKYNIEATGNLGPITRKKLNAMFSS